MKANVFHGKNEIRVEEVDKPRAGVGEAMRIDLPCRNVWVLMWRSTRDVDVVAEVKRLTGGGADVSIEALGTQKTFESALRSLRPAGTLSSLGVYSGKLAIPYEAFAAGIGDHRIVTTLCPGGKERMRRLMEVVRRGRVDLTPLLTHTFSLDNIGQAYELFGRATGRRDESSD